MTVRFDRETGRLRLDTPAVSSLLGWALGEPAVEVADLVDAGVVTPAGPHPDLRPAITALADPVCRLRMHLVTDDGDEQLAEAWVTDDAAAFLLPLPDAMHELLTVSPGFVPEGIARFVRLGPRPWPSAEPLEVSLEAFEELFSEDAARRQVAAREVVFEDDDRPLRSVVDLLAAGPWHVWTAEMSWTRGDGSTDGRSVHAVDTDAGMCLVAAAEETVTLVALPPREIWRLLTRMLPDEDDLSQSRVK